jgi:hypothetical protein
MSYSKLTKKFVATMNKLYWPFPPESVEEIKKYLSHGDNQTIAESIGVKNLIVWDHLNRPRSRFRLDVMKATLAVAEMNMMASTGKIELTLLRDLLEKIDTFYNAERYNSRLQIIAQDRKELQPYAEYAQSLAQKNNSNLPQPQTNQL